MRGLILNFLLMLGSGSIAWANPCEAHLASNALTTFEIKVSNKELLDQRLSLERIHPNKALVFGKALSTRDRVEEGVLTFRKIQLRGGDATQALLRIPIVDHTEVVAIENVFDYQSDSAEEMHVYLNFADPNLFAFWHTPLFAQDEMQVAEHPSLAGLWSYMQARQRGGLVLNTWQNEAALILNVPRLVAIESSGIYGNAFAQTNPSVIDQKSKILETPTASNILAIAALQVPADLTGKPYDSNRLSYHFLTALTGFYAARESAAGRRLVLHTGNWGTGAFGNNPRVIAALQILAARMAGVDELEYHTVQSGMTREFEKGELLVKEITTELKERGQPLTAGNYIGALLKRNLPYGQGNGT